MTTINRGLTEFAQHENCFRLLNSSPNGFMAHCTGKQIRFPGSNEVIEPDPALVRKLGAGYKPFVSMQDEKGEYIPGTIVIKDEYNNSKLEWDAKEALRIFLGVTKEGSMDSAYSRRGMFVLSAETTRAEIEALRKKGLEAWERFAANNALLLVTDFSRRQALAAQAGLPAPYAERSVVEAQQLLNSMNKKYSDLTLGQDEKEIYGTLKKQQIDELKEEAKREMLNDPEMLQLLAEKLANMGEPPAPTPRKKA